MTATACPVAPAKTPVRRTEAQRQASRQNGQKSRGPTSEAGKRNCRRNALRHGLSPNAQLVTDELQHEVDTDLYGFRQEFRPVNPYEAQLVDAAALATARLHRLLKTELEHTQSRVRGAVEAWDAARAALIEQQAALLETNPASAVRQLKRTAEGCDYLADRIDALIESLEGAESLEQDLLDEAAQLLGRGGASAAAFVASFDAADVDELRQLLKARYEELCERGDRLWETIDGPNRVASPRLAVFDPGPEYARLHRYINAAERQLRRALRELQQSRARGPARPAAILPDFAPPRPPSPPRSARRQNEPGASQPAGSQGSATRKPTAPALRPEDLDPFEELGALDGVETLPISITPPRR